MVRILLTGYAYIFVWLYLRVNNKKARYFCAPLAEFFSSGNCGLL